MSTHTGGLFLLVFMARLPAYYFSAQVLVEKCVSGQSATGRVEAHPNPAVIVKKTVVQKLLSNHGQASHTAAGQYLPTLRHNSAPNLSDGLLLCTDVQVSAFRVSILFR